VEVGVDGPVVKRGRRAGAFRARRFKITLTLHPLADAALIAALDAVPPGQRSATVREWLRGGCTSPTPTPADDDRPDLEELGIAL